MSSKSFFNFQYRFSRKPSSSKKTLSTPTQSFRASRPGPPTVFQPNADEMRRVFNKFDKNHDGKVSKDEYALALGALGAKNTRPEVTKAFHALDADGDGFIDFEEFMRAQESGGGVQTEDIKSAFGAFDLDGNGKITAEELSEVFRRLGERCSLEACRKMIRGADADGDGMINKDEFMTLMTRTMKSA